MIRKTTLFPALVALAVTATACSELSGPGGSTLLTTGEVRSLAFGVSGLATSEMEEATWTGSSFSLGTRFALSGTDAAADRKGGPGVGLFGGFGIWGPRGLGVHGTTTTTVERTARCPQGGTMNRSTEIVAVVDTVAHTGSVTSTSTDTRRRAPSRWTA